MTTHRPIDTRDSDIWRISLLVVFVVYSSILLYLYAITPPDNIYWELRLEQYKTAEEIMLESGLYSDPVFATYTAGPTTGSILIFSENDIPGDNK